MSQIERGYTGGYLTNSFKLPRTWAGSTWISSLRGHPATVAGKNSTSTIPITFVAGGTGASHNVTASVPRSGFWLPADPLLEELSSDEKRRFWLCRSYAAMRPRSLPVALTAEGAYVTTSSSELAGVVQSAPLPSVKGD